MKYVAQELSNLSATVRKETSYGDDLLLLRQVCLEGLAMPCCDSAYLRWLRKATLFESALTDSVLGELMTQNAF